MLGTWVAPVLNKKGADYPYRQTRAYLRSADVAIANLEAPFTLYGHPFEKRFNFKVPPRFAKGLSDAGISVVNLANNHTLDYGILGLLSTLITLDDVGVKYCGAGMSAKEAHSPAIVRAGRFKIALFGYSMTFPVEFYAKSDTGGTAYPEPELMQAAISACRDTVDFVIASFHWGAEKRQTPKEYQIEFAHMAIDSGADLVLGHHPHVLQGFEIYKNRLIAYSLGNYAFGSYSRRAVDSIVLKTYLRKDGLRIAYCFPINVDNREVEFQPSPADSLRRTRIISTLRNLSIPLNNGRNIVRETGLIYGDWAEFPIWAPHDSTVAQIPTLPIMKTRSSALLIQNSEN